MATWLRCSRERAIAYGLLAACIGAVFAGFAPGHINIDSISQIQEVDRGAFTNRHATMLLALWYPLFQVGLGPAFVLALQIAVFALGSYLVLRTAFERLGAAAVASLVCLWPPVFGMLGTVGRDTWFAALMVATYGLLARAGEVEWPRRSRWLWLAAIALWLALASRQNAFVAMIPAAVVLAAMALERLRERRRIRRLGGRPRLAALGAGLALTLGMLASQAAGAIAVRTEDVDPEQYLYIYDLAALSERADENLFPADVARDDLDLLEERFIVDSMVDLVYLPPLFVTTPLEPAQLESLRDAWLDRVTGDPGAYIAERVELFARQLALTRSARYVFAPDVLENDFGYEIWFEGLNSAALDYLDLFTEPGPDTTFFFPINGDVLYAVWAYLLAAAAAAAFLLRRGLAIALRIVGALAVSALTLQLGLFFLAMGTEYRFEFPAVAASILALAVAVRVAATRARLARYVSAPS